MRAGGLQAAGVEVRKRSRLRSGTLLPRVIVSLRKDSGLKGSSAPSLVSPVIADFHPARES
jgi:hypothetical protein